MKQSPRNSILSPTSNQTYLFQMTEETAVSPCLGSLKGFRTPHHVRRTTLRAIDGTSWYLKLMLEVSEKSLTQRWTSKIASPLWCVVLQSSLSSHIVKKVSRVLFHRVLRYDFRT